MQTVTPRGHGARSPGTSDTASTIALKQHLNWPDVQKVCRVVRKWIIRGQRQTETA